MPAYQILRQEEQEDQYQLKAQLEIEIAGCMEARTTYKNKVRDFMVKKGVWHISELDYPLREEFQKFLEGQVDSVSYRLYEKAFDRIKQHSIQNQLREIKEDVQSRNTRTSFCFYPIIQIRM